MALPAVLAGMTVPAQANLITNSGFEAGDLSGWTFSGDAAARSSAYGYVSSPEGLWAAYLKTGTLSQVLATTPGSDYTLRLWLWGRSGTFGNELIGYWDNQKVFMTQDTSWDSKWYSRSFAVTATSSTTVLEFGSVTAADTGAGFDWVLDDVSVEAFKGPRPGPIRIVDPGPITKVSPVPEPSTFILFALGGGLLGLLARRRRAS